MTLPQMKSLNGLISIERERRLRTIRKEFPLLLLVDRISERTVCSVRPFARFNHLKLDQTAILEAPLDRK